MGAFPDEVLRYEPFTIRELNNTIVIKIILKEQELNVVGV
jgi:hypothetical protein